jgi:pimeloyl-ACP methyl ester carboxylesterase
MQMSSLITITALASLLTGAGPSAGERPARPVELIARTQDAPKVGQAAGTAKPVKELILPGESFLVVGRPAFIFTPAADKRRTPQPWIFYAPTLPPYPDSHEKWMHEQFVAAGIAVAGIDVGEAYGGTEGRRLFTEFYRELTGKRGFATRPCLLGRSRGGLWLSSWAADNPDKVAGFAGIYPVFDLRTFPGFTKAAPRYDLTPAQLESRLTELNPIERIEVLARRRVPAFLIHGVDDKVVSLEKNSAEFAARYRAAGAADIVTLVAVPGQGHNFWEGFFRCRELIDFAIDRARSGSMQP